MKKLFIDLEGCSKCRDCTVSCSYFYHPDNNGINSLRELAHFALICRHCEEAPCVKVCPKEALEKQKDGLLKRYSMRCVACRSCIVACPFGTIYPEVIPYLLSSCDYCLDRANRKLPLCVETCPEKVIRYEEVEQDSKKNYFAVGKNLIVHYIPWERK